MEINVNREGSTVEIWLSRAEKQDAALRATLEPMLLGYKNIKYTVAVFESGEDDLTEGTESLLLRNITGAASAQG